MSVELKKEKPSRIGQFLNSEYKFENFLLVALSIFAIVFGVLILQDILTPVGFLAGTVGTVFAWVLVGLGAVSLLLWAIPFYRPSMSEIRHIRGYKPKEYLQNVLTVIIFTIILALVFIFFDWIIQLLKDLINVA